MLIYSWDKLTKILTYHVISFDDTVDDDFGQLEDICGKNCEKSDVPSNSCKIFLVIPYSTSHGSCLCIIAF